MVRLTIQPSGRGKRKNTCFEDRKSRHGPVFAGESHHKTAASAVASLSSICGRSKDIFLQKLDSFVDF